MSIRPPSISPQGTAAASSSEQQPQQQQQHYSGSITLVRRLHNLASDVDNQPLICRRGILPSLLLFLQNKEDAVRLCAAETLVMLSSHPENPDVMAREKGLSRIVASTYRSCAATDPELHRLCATILRNLAPALEQLSPSRSPEHNNTNNDGAAAAAADGDDLARRAIVTARVRSAAAFGPPPVSLSLQLRMAELLSAEKRADVARVLDSVRGVVSYSIDHDLVTVFVSCSKEQLIATLKAEAHVAEVEVVCECAVRDPDCDDAAVALPSASALEVSPGGAALQSLSASGRFGASSYMESPARLSGPASEYKRSLLAGGGLGGGINKVSSSATGGAVMSPESNSLAARVRRSREQQVQEPSMWSNFWAAVRDIVW